MLVLTRPRAGRLITAFGSTEPWPSVIPGECIGHVEGRKINLICFSFNIFLLFFDDERDEQVI